MDAESIMESADFKRCADFHGHVCPGLAIGFKAAQAGLQRLAENRAEDEEIVAIVETDACSADAVQVITGCTFGKGNFFFKDRGKMALTLLSRKTGEGLRLCLQPDKAFQDPEHFALLQRLASGQADEEEQRRFRELHFQRTCKILETPVEELFTVHPAKVELPAKARIEPSVICNGCGEPTMRSKTADHDGKQLCRSCLEKAAD